MTPRTVSPRTVSPRTVSPRIRPYRPDDLRDVYEVCLRTGDAGGDATGLYSDDDLLGDVFAAPYVVLEPESAFVVDTGERVSGYIIAAPDTRRFVDRFRQEWLPVLDRKYRHVDPPVTREDEIVHLGFTPDRMLVPELDEYPAHLHIDLLPELQGQGLGRELVRTLLGSLRERGVPGVHLGYDPRNTGARAFYDRLGFVQLPSGATTMGIRSDAAV